MSSDVQRFAYILHRTTGQTANSLLNNSQTDFTLRCGGISFSNKTQRHNERMELSGLHLIDFDQVAPCCLSDVPAVL